jgi:hypothetical protein
MGMDLEPDGNFFNRLGLIFFDVYQGFACGSAS